MAPTVEPDQLYVLHAEMCKVFSHPYRLRIIDVLRAGELPVTEIAQATGSSLPNVSQHLALMRRQGILTYRREGKSLLYRLTNPRLVEAFDILRELLVERIRAEHELVGG